MLKFQTMFTPAKIQECLYGMIGFRQTADQNLPMLDADLLQSSSGLYFNDLHPLINIENLQACAENYDQYSVQEYDAAITYGEGAIVRESGQDYESLTSGNIGNDPASSPTQWRKTNLISGFLRNTVRTSIVKMMNAVYAEKNLDSAGRSLLDNVVLYDGAGNFTDKIQKRGRFSGFKIGVKQRDVSVMLNKVGLQLDTAQQLTLYLYHDSQIDPIKTFVVDYTKANSFQWVDIEETVLSFVNENINAGGQYALGYYEEDLVGQAIRRDTKFSEAPCTCHGRSYRLYQQWSKNLSIYPFEVGGSHIDYSNKTMWDADHETVFDGHNWGLNFMLSAVCDITDLICRNKTVFINAIGKQVEADLLNIMAYSLRANQKKELAKQHAMFALDNREHYSQGVTAELKAAIKGLDFNLAGLNSVCLPCSNSGFKSRFSTAY